MDNETAKPEKARKKNKSTVMDWLVGAPVAAVVFSPVLALIIWLGAWMLEKGTDLPAERIIPALGGVYLLRRFVLPLPPRWRPKSWKKKPHYSLMTMLTVIGGFLFAWWWA